PRGFAPFRIGEDPFAPEIELGLLEPLSIPQGALQFDRLDRKVHILRQADQDVRLTHRVAMVQEIRRTVFELDAQGLSPTNRDAIWTACPDVDDPLEAQDVIEAAEQKDHSHLVLGFEIKGASV